MISFLNKEMSTMLELANDSIFEVKSKISNFLLYQKNAINMKENGESEQIRNNNDLK